MSVVFGDLWVILAMHIKTEKHREKSIFFAVLENGGIGGVGFQFNPLRLDFRIRDDMNLSSQGRHLIIPKVSQCFLIWEGNLSLPGFKILYA